MSENKASLITPEVRKEIDRSLEKYPPDRKQSATLIALRLVQNQNDGWLSEELMDAVADYLELPRIAVYEVATFYSMYDLKPAGKHKICVCTNISCMLRGSDEIVKHIQKRLGNVPLDEQTPDGRYILKEVECLAACVSAPVMQIDYDKYYENLTIEKVDAILDQLDKKEAADVA